MGASLGAPRAPLGPAWSCLAVSVLCINADADTKATGAPAGASLAALRPLAFRAGGSPSCATPCQAPVKQSVRLAETLHCQKRGVDICQALGMSSAAAV